MDMAVTGTSSLDDHRYLPEKVEEFRSRSIRYDRYMGRRIEGFKRDAQWRPTTEVVAARRPESPRRSPAPEVALLAGSNVLLKHRIFVAL